MSVVTRLEDLGTKVWSSDLSVRQEAGPALLALLSDCDDDVFDSGYDWNGLCNGLVRWISGTNFKVSVFGLQAVSMVATRMGEDLSPILTSMLPAIVDRLGDSKEQVRKESQSLIQVLMSQVKSPKEIFEEMLPRAKAHKNAKVRESMLLCLSETLQNFGARELALNKLIPSVCDLISDSNAAVRDQAIETLCDVYKLVGEPMRSDIMKKRMLTAQKEACVLAKFDELLQSGQVTATPSRSSSRAPSMESLNDEGASRVKKSGSTNTLNKRTMPLKKSPSTHKKGGGIGGGADSVLLTEENLDNYIYEYPNITIDSPRQLADMMQTISASLDVVEKWEDRIEKLKILRSIVFAGVDHYKEFWNLMKSMSRQLEKTIKDLRSQVVREACITVAAMATEMKNSFGVIAEKLLTPLFSQLLINVKVMNVSAHICCRRVISQTQSTRMIPVICNEVLTSKSVMCRRKCAEYVELIFQVWDPSLLTKNIAILENSIKSGINDADAETRTISRRTYWIFHKSFEQKAEQMMKTFDNSKQKMLRETKIGQSTGQATSPTGSTSSTLRRVKKAPGPAAGSSATLPKPKISKSTPDLSQLGKCSTMPRQQFKTPGKSATGPRTAVSSSPVPDRTPAKARTAVTPGTGVSGVRRSVSAKSVNSLASQDSRSATLRRANNSANRASPGRASPARNLTSPRQGTAIRKSASANLNQDSLATAFGRNTIPRMQSQDSIASSVDSSSNEDIHEIMRAAENTSWKVREEGVLKLQTRINEERGFNARERKIVLNLFETLLNDNHARILGLTLDVLEEFLQLYRTNLIDWGDTVLAKGLYLQSMKQTSSNLERVLRLLDTLHKSFQYDVQLTWCFTILDSRQVNGNNKMKGTLLEYMSCTFDVMDPMEFIQTKESSVGLRVILASTRDPKAPDIRKKSQILLATMFRHSPPVFGSILNTLTEVEQGQCVQLLQDIMPDMMSQESEVLQGYPGYMRRRSVTPDMSPRAASEEGGANIFDAIHQRFGSTGSYNSASFEGAEEAVYHPQYDNINMLHADQVDGLLAPEAQVITNNSINGSLEPDVMFSVLEALLGGTGEEKSGALVQAVGLLKEDVVTSENSYDLLDAILQCTEEPDVDLVGKALKVLQKFLIYQPEQMAGHCEEVVTKMVRAKSSCTAPELDAQYLLLIRLYKHEAVLKLALPMLKNEGFPVLLSVINLLYQTLKSITVDVRPIIEDQLPQLTATVCAQCNHVETNVRKQSIFCLVELLLHFGTETVDPLLEPLSISQKKLVYLYYNRHQHAGNSTPAKAGT